MNLKRRLEERIQRKEKEIQQLEAQIGEAKAYIQGLQDTLKMLPREKGETEITIRSNSLPGKALQALRKAGKPLHIKDLLKALGQEVTRKNRSSLSGSLGAYVRQNEIFTRPSPNTFGLTEWGESPSNEDDLPDEFGAIPEEEEVSN